MNKFIATTIQAFNENRYIKRNDEKYKNCLLSDLTRMELIEDFFKKINLDSNYNIEAPNYFKLIDDWNGYDEQVYIQNDLANNEFIFFEGWVDNCWEAAYLKPEYKNLNKTDIIEKIVKDRFPRIADEFDYDIKSLSYFKYKTRYIMKVTFEKKNVINESISTIDYSKFPLSTLVKQAKKFSVFKDFSNFYSFDIYHGYYWHLTDNPNFKISDKTGSRDMSSMSSGKVMENGAIMLTSDLAYWDEHYNTSKNSWKRDIKRNYVVLFDASDIEPKFLKQIGRGFGNEIYLNADISKQLKQIGVYKLNYAKALDKKFHNIIPQSENELLNLWNFANTNKNS